MASRLAFTKKKQSSFNEVRRDYDEECEELNGTKQAYGEKSENLTVPEHVVNQKRSRNSNLSRQPSYNKSELKLKKCNSHYSPVLQMKIRVIDDTDTDSDVTKN